MQENMPFVKKISEKTCFNDYLYFLYKQIGIIIKKNQMGRVTMKKGLILLVSIAAVALLLGGCASKGVADKASQGGKESHTLTIATGDFHEFCDMWEVGETVKFAFTSTKPVMFNVHYHAGHEKQYAIKDVLVDDFSGNFVVQNKEVHCGMWQNNNDSFVKLTYEMEVVPK